MSTWDDFVTAALLGTERSKSPSLPPALEPLCRSDFEPAPRAEHFLNAAGAFALWRRAGYQPPKSPPGNAAAADEEWPPVSPQSGAHLREILGGRCAALLPEFLRTAEALRRRVPFECLPALLERGRNDPALRGLLEKTGGQRVRWLASQNSDWAWQRGTDEIDWETASRDLRVTYLRNARASDAAEARRKLGAVWKAEPADNRTAFLATLEIGLSMDDEPFLESALDDRSKEVRRVAIDLLSRLPGSRLAARMAQRVEPLLAWKRGGLLSKASLEVTLPEKPDAAGLRDGLEARVLGAQKVFGERAAWLVLMLGSIPPHRWGERFQQPPEKLIAALRGGEFARAVVTGWAWGALRAADAQWAGAILDGETRPEAFSGLDDALLNLLPEDERAERLRRAVREGALVLTDHERWAATVAALDRFDGYWPDALAREVLTALRRTAARGIPWHLRANVERMLLRVPAHLLPEAERDWPADQEGVAAIADFLHFRSQILAELHR